MKEIVEPTLFEKGESTDHRGSLEYYNTLNLEVFNERPPLPLDEVFLLFL